MRGRNLFKLVLDISMAAVFALLFNKNVLGGLRFHEAAGLAIGLTVIFHLLLNWKWIRQITLKIFNRNISLKTRMGHVLNILLLVSFSLIILSGILISKTLLVNIKTDNPYFWGRLHVAVSYLTLLFLGVHAGLHWNWIKGVFRRITGITHGKRVAVYAVNVVLILVLAFGIYQVYSTRYFSQVSMLVQSSDKEKLFKGGKMQSIEDEKNVIREGVSKEQLIEELKKQGKTVTVIEKGKEGGKPGHGLKGGEAEAGPWNTLVSYLSIILAFATITAFLDRLVSRKSITKKLN